MRRLLLALTAAFALAGCAGAARSPFRGPEAVGTLLVVENRNWLDGDVYLMLGGGRYRLGFVAGNTRREFRVPPEAQRRTDLALRFEPVGSRETATSPEFPADLGTIVHWTIEARFAFSHLSISSP